jgi:hypothetical protein
MFGHSTNLRKDYLNPVIVDRIEPYIGVRISTTYQGDVGSTPYILGRQTYHLSVLHRRYILRTKLHGNCDVIF